MVRTLVGNGFTLHEVTQKPTYTLFSCHRFDEFGSQARYEFVLCEQPLGPAAMSALTRHAKRQGSQPVIVGTAVQNDLGVPSLDWPSFLQKCGGPIKSWLPLNPAYASSLITLGHDQPVPGLLGRPDDLFEEYVHAGLQFLLADRVIRYGQNRLGEVLPDGGAFGRNQPIFLYDAKAYAKGYPLSRNSIRQFADYVRNFQTKYEVYLGRLHTFLVVSGHFRSKAQKLRNYSEQLYAECGVSLSYLEAKDMSCIVECISARPVARLALDWRRILVGNKIRCNSVVAAIRAAERDRLVIQ
jgi:hypothetical protein